MCYSPIWETGFESEVIDQKRWGKSDEKKKRFDFLSEGEKIPDAVTDVPAGSSFLLCVQLYAVAGHMGRICQVQLPGRYFWK